MQSELQVTELPVLPGAPEHQGTFCGTAGRLHIPLLTQEPEHRDRARGSPHTLSLDIPRACPSTASARAPCQGWTEQALSRAPTELLVSHWHPQHLLSNQISCWLRKAAFLLTSCYPRLPSPHPQYVFCHACLLFCVKRLCVPGGR